MSVNKVILMGNLGKDPDVRYTEGGVAVANISLATSERSFTTKDGVQVPERVEWHNLILWRGLAEVAEKFLKKGSKIYVEGKMRTRSYEDQSGVNRYITEVFVDVMEMLGSSQGKPLPQEYPGTATATPQAAPRQQQTAQRQSSVQNSYQQTDIPQQQQAAQQQKFNYSSPGFAAASADQQGNSDDLSF